MSKKPTIPTGIRPPRPSTAAEGTRHARRTVDTQRRRDTKHAREATPATTSVVVKSKLKRATKELELVPALPDFGTCTHPTIRSRGICRQKAIGIYRIPDDYKPELRHANQPQLPAEAPLCGEHLFYLQSHVAGTTKAIDAPHRSRCAVCHHPKHEWVVNAWVKWGMSTAQACTELDVSYTSWRQHIVYYKLDEKKSERINTLRALQRIAEEGMGGKVTVKDSIAALKELARQRGDVVENVNVRGVVAHIDLSSMSDAALVKRARELATEVERQEQQEQAVEAEIINQEAGPTEDNEE